MTNQIKIYNNRIIIPVGHPIYQPVREYFVTTDKSTEFTRVVKVYTEDTDTGDIILPRGFLFLIRDQLVDNYVNKSSNELGNYNPDDEVDIESLLPGITLRKDQVSVTEKIVKLKRGLVQQSTGSGKTEILAAVLMYYYKSLGYYPDTLILAPTSRIVRDTVARMNKYGIPAEEYHDSRHDIKGKIIISHPMALNNDIQKDSNLLSSVKIFFEDESHHGGAVTWESLYRYLYSVEVSIGVSASIIDSSNLPITNVRFLEPEVAKVVGCTGPVISDISAAYYIKEGILAEPVLIRMDNFADDKLLTNPKNWHEIRRTLLESEERTELVVDSAEVFSNVDFKVLILVNTKKHSRELLLALGERGLGEKSACSFGSNVYETIQDGKVKTTDKDIQTKFNEGSVNILIGTSHMYEGVDIPKLDAVILAVVGKNVRRVIQGIGRALRVSKSGKHAYIMDYTDHGSDVLSRHSEERLQVCLGVIGIPITNIHGVKDKEELEKVLSSLEE